MKVARLLRVGLAGLPDGGIHSSKVIGSAEDYGFPISDNFILLSKRRGTYDIDKIDTQVATGYHHRVDKYVK